MNESLELYNQLFPEYDENKAFDRETLCNIRLFLNKFKKKHLKSYIPINILFDGPPSHKSGRFIEVETDDGKGISVGRWIKKKGGFWALRISELPEDF